LLIHAVSAQFVAYIINDKDGYTNIREKPNAKSQIVGKVQKYQVFSIDDSCGDEIYPMDKWEGVQSYGNPNGYIFRKNILELNALPVIVGKGDLKLLSGKKESTVTGKNDSITITMKLQLFNMQNHKEFAYGGASDAYDDNLNNNSFNNEILYECFDIF